MTKVSKFKSIIREAIYKLLEEETKFSEGDRVIDQDGAYGTISLAKHPYYAVKLDSNGATQSYHFTNLTKDETESDFGKYDTSTDFSTEEPIIESAPSEIIILDGLLEVHKGLNITDVLSDIRSIPGVTVVRTIDIKGTNDKSKLHIKIDPFPFKGKSEDSIKDYIKQSIRKIPGVKEFWSNPTATNEIRIRIK